MAQAPIITSRDNARVKQAALLAKSAAARDEAGLFFAEGLRLCQDLAAVQKPRVAFVRQDLLARQPALALLAEENYAVLPHVAQKLAGTQSSQGLCCLFSLPGHTAGALDVQAGVLVCEAIQDPANLGAMLRCAAALGLGGAVLSPGCADPYGPKALRAAMGATLRLPLVCRQPAEQAAAFLRAAGAVLYAATLDAGARNLTQLCPKRPFALMVGNEGAGLSQAALAAADEHVYLPMHHGMESLNAAAAAAVFIYCLKNGCTAE